MGYYSEYSDSVYIETRCEVLEILTDEVVMFLTSHYFQSICNLLTTVSHRLDNMKL